MGIDAALWVLGAAFVAVGLIIEVRSGRSLQDVFRVTWREMAAPAAVLLALVAFKITVRRTH